MILSISGIEGPAAVPAIERILPGPCIGNSNAILPMITVAGVPPFHSDEMEAERRASGAADSRSDEGAEAIGGRLQAVVRCRSRLGHDFQGQVIVRVAHRAPERH